MTNYTDLIARLRWDNGEVLSSPDELEAAAALEAQGRRLAKAEALLRENAGYEPMPLSWFERVRAFLTPPADSDET